jgi:hypothetical protein
MARSQESGVRSQESPTGEGRVKIKKKIAGRNLSVFREVRKLQEFNSYSVIRPQKLLF